MKHDVYKLLTDCRAYLSRPALNLGGDAAVLIARISEIVDNRPWVVMYADNNGEWYVAPGAYWNHVDALAAKEAHPATTKRITQILISKA